MSQESLLKFFCLTERAETLHRHKLAARQLEAKSRVDFGMFKVCPPVTLSSAVHI